MVAAAEEMVRAAIGAPPPSKGFPWYDGDAVASLFARHGMHATVRSRHDISFTAESPAAHFENEVLTHPMSVRGFQVLAQQGRADEAHARLLGILTEQNEDPASFRVTSHYVVIGCDRGHAAP